MEFLIDYLLFGPPSFVYVFPLTNTARICRVWILGLITGSTTSNDIVFIVRFSSATRIVTRARSRETKRTLFSSNLKIINVKFVIEGISQLKFDLQWCLQ